MHEVAVNTVYTGSCILLIRQVNTGEIRGQCNTGTVYTVQIRGIQALYTNIQVLTVNKYETNNDSI